MAEPQVPENTAPEAAPAQSLEGGVYEIIRSRLQTQSDTLRTRLQDLNARRKAVFGAIETHIAATERITTDNNCTPRDMISIGGKLLFGYNVLIGLRAETTVRDVFSVYRFENRHFVQEEPELIRNEQFEEDFRNLYRYFRETVFVKFTVIGPHMYMVFRIGKGVTDIKAFKWLMQDGTLAYLDNRSELELIRPAQYEFEWKRTHLDMHRKGPHPHISILDRIFVETVGGDLTIKIEDNTHTGLGIYSEEVAVREQNLEDAEFFYADLGNIILLKVRPFQEKHWRYIAYNDKLHEARRVNSLEESCVLLPDGHGILFPDGIYLQTGDFKQFDTQVQGVHFERRILSPNGEDYLYVFHHDESGTYVLLSYNLISQQVSTPLICHGFSIFHNGELCLFRAEAEPQKHHAIQIWQTPYTKTEAALPGADTENFLYKIGNKDIVRAMAECNEVLTLLSKQDQYANLYLDLTRLTGDILDTWFWLKDEQAARLDEPVREIRAAASAAIDEFEKVQRIRKHTAAEMKRVGDATTELITQVRRAIPDHIDQYVQYLASMRGKRGELVGLKELRYIDLTQVQALESSLTEQQERTARDCASFLLREDALTPYRKTVTALEAGVPKVTKAVEAADLEKKVDQAGKELEMLIDIVSNLRIEDATQTTRIIDAISAVYTHLNQVRAALRMRRKELAGTESIAEFNAQLKLLNQATLNYLDLATAPEKCEELLNKLMVQVEELESKFSEFDTFITQLADKREEIYTAFESRKLQLTEKRNQRADTLHRSGDRILKGIQSRVMSMRSVQEINACFAGDLMVDKVRDLVKELQEMGDSARAEEMQNRLKSLREEALRSLRDKEELFAEGGNIIRLGRHAFAINSQRLDLTLLERDGDLWYHLTGTSFFEPVQDEGLNACRTAWKQELVSEDTEVYRAEYLAWLMFRHFQEDAAALHAFETAAEAAQLEQVRSFMAPRYAEGYAKGVHDADARILLSALVQLHQQIGLLRFLPETRACAALWWLYDLQQPQREAYWHRLKGLGAILQAFPGSRENAGLLAQMEGEIRSFCTDSGLFAPEYAATAAEYLFQELSRNDDFIAGPDAARIVDSFEQYLRTRSLYETFHRSLNQLGDDWKSRYSLCLAWVAAYARQENLPGFADTQEECAALLMAGSRAGTRVLNIALHREIEGLRGEHSRIPGGRCTLEYNAFMHRLGQFASQTVPLHQQFTARKKTLADTFRQRIRLEQFQPKVLTSFVRNRLLDEVYLPLIGDNLAKQIGVAGENKRTDRMGMLLLISPPGYGKTTLMEYVANRLGLIFMKINGPAIGHKITSLDPSEATNAAARDELEKLNLALEMGDNVMLYVDDIQHTNPEFLQKFISLCDAQRKIEGIWKGQSKTYDLRGRRFCVVMAGNPYTESGEKFQIPDMLANRSDTYNLGDIIGNSREAFTLSYIENSLTANPVLNVIASRSHKDVHTFLRMARDGQREGLDFEGNYTPEESQEIVSVLQKLLTVREIILTVNQEYIASAAQAAEFRTEPPFRLQGSYRDMGKIAGRISPIMNAEELRSLIESHYKNEAQTLTTGAEANLLKFREMMGWLTETEAARWQEICDTFRKRQKMFGMETGDRLGQVIAHLGAFSDGLEAIRKALDKS